MENFDSKNYRDNLAEDLKDIRKTDPETAQQVLEEEKGTTRYKSAEEAHADKRIEARSNSKEVRKQKELLDEEEVKMELKRNEILGRLTSEARKDLENVKFDIYELVIGEKTKDQVLEELKNNGVVIAYGSGYKNWEDSIDITSEKKKQEFISFNISEIPSQSQGVYLKTLEEDLKKYGLDFVPKEAVLLFMLPENLKRKILESKYLESTYIITNESTEEGLRGGYNAFSISGKKIWFGPKKNYGDNPAMGGIINSEDCIFMVPTKKENL